MPVANTYSPSTHRRPTPAPPLPRRSLPDCRPARAGVKVERSGVSTVDPSPLWGGGEGIFPSLLPHDRGRLEHDRHRRIIGDRVQRATRFTQTPLEEVSFIRHYPKSSCFGNSPCRTPATSTLRLTSPKPAVFSLRRSRLTRTPSSTNWNQPSRRRTHSSISESVFSESNRAFWPF